ncbi:hypothetical protein [Streptomyces fulvoviolaceus]|uniref:hypothetical protein n=1 Tax=Streptomyces fulvoviolaceus TaxID=285535 RepID=UPI0021C1E53A|nr:hypothetical protein [Streptomyces fulvoviolaceus]MCT9084535.1 hypothetical protein [Streptomyces fulvoviolaceus]
MSGWNGYSSGSGAEHEPSEERGQAAWTSGQTGFPPPWSSAETQTSFTPPWATAETQASLTPPWVTAETQASLTPPWALPASVSAPPARHGVRRALVAFAVSVLLGVGVGVGVWLLIRDTSVGSGSGAGPGAGPAASVTATTPPPDSNSPSTAVGYRRTEDPIGYAVEIPAGWARTEKQGRLAPVVTYDAPADGRRLQIFRLTEATPAESLDLAENDPGYGFSRQPGYQVLDRASGADWSELSYRYDDTDLGPRQVVDHRFEAADGTLYAIRSTGPENLTPELVRTPLTRAVDSFCPAGRECA